MAEKKQSNIDLEDIGLLGQIYRQVLKRLTLRRHHHFRLVYPFIQWIWPDSSPGYINASVYTIVNDMPQSGWFYASSGAGFYSTYKSMLSVAPKLTIGPDKKVEEAQKKVDSAWANLKATEKGLNDAWTKAYSEDPSIIYSEWISTSDWMVKNQKAQDQFDEAISEKIKAIQGENKDYISALDACKMPSATDSSKPGFVKCKDSGVDVWCASYEINNGKAWDDTTDLEQGMNLGELHFELGANIPTFLQSNSDASLARAWVENAASALENPNFFTNDSRPGDTLSFFASRGSDGKWHAFGIKRDKNYKVFIQISKSRRVSVQPGAWYDKSYLNVLAKEDRWNKPFTTMDPPSAVFGRDGILSFRIDGMLIGCHVKFTISLSPDEFKQHVHAFLTSVSLRIGPFRFGPERLRGEMSWTKSADYQKFQLHGETDSNNWFILGFRVVNPGL